MQRVTGWIELSWPFKDAENTTISKVFFVWQDVQWCVRVGSAKMNDKAEWAVTKRAALLVRSRSELLDRARTPIISSS